MPEIIEVVLTSQYLLTKLKNKCITNVKVLGGRYSRHGLKSLEPFKKCLPMTINNIDTKGKFMWFELLDKDNKKIYILNTLGLGGVWSFTKELHSNIEFTIKNKKGKEYCLYFEDPRNFGTIEFCQSKTKIDQKLNKLAPDYLKTNWTKEEFYNWVQKYKDKSEKNKLTEIVKILMNQNKINAFGCGLGNYMVPETLYRAKISPYRTLGSLTQDEIFTIATTIKYLLKLVYLTNETGYMIRFEKFIPVHRLRVEEGIYPNYQADVILDPEDKFAFLVYRQKKDPDGKEVVGDKIIKGRTTYWVPEVQK